MKGYRVFSKSIGYCFLNAFLVFLMIFLLLPAGTPRINADSNNATLETLSDNSTLPQHLITNNSTISVEVINDENASVLSDNITTDVIEIKTNKLTVKPDESANITSPSGKMKLDIPKASVKELIKIEFTERFINGSTGLNMLKLFELNAFSISISNNDNSSKSQSRTDNITSDNISLSSENASLEDKSSSEIIGEKINNIHFEKELTLTIQHSTDELAGLDLDSLHLYYLDEQTHQWVLVPDKLDRETLTLTATISHFSTYGEQANPLQNGPGRVMASEVDLHSGSASYSYPIELPPGPGGFTPSLTLTYNSGSVDGMKNKRDMGSWVGIGWSLSLGKISCELSSNQYFLDLNGASYKLISSDGINFITQPDQYLQITRSGSSNNTWEVRDKGGTYYRFGGTTQSEQYVYDTSKKYNRWDLSLIRDTNSNNATIDYIQELTGTSPNYTVRSAYTTNITYGNNVIQFTLGYDEYNSTDGYVRYDNPISYGSQPAPKIMETRRLNTIEIKSNGILVRKYAFDYTTTNRMYSFDHSGIYYSGSMELSSITQYGADGISALPAITFKYQNKQVYRKTSEGTYYGNPGNPAFLRWPFLTKVYSGYGGAVVFDYTQIPDTSVLNTWSRQAVTKKTVSPYVMAGWNFSKQMTITGSSSANLTNYQMKLTVYKGSGTDTGSAVYLNNNCRSDFGDIRFTKADGYTELDYWIESSVPNTSAVIWVEFDKIPASINSTFYIYYGNSTITTTSNGEQTFPFFDDFSGTSLDVTKWMVGGNVGVANGLCTITGLENSGSGIISTYSQLYGATRFKASMTNNYFDFLSWGMGSPPGLIEWNWPAQGLYFQSWDNLSSTTTGPFSGANPGTMYIWDILWKSSWTQGIFNGNSGVPHTTHVPSTSLPLDFAASKSGALVDTVVIDYAFFRNWVDPEPTFGTWSVQPVPSGVGYINQESTYSYTGDPAYKGTSWDQEFRGWSEVKETDAANNYVIHYYYTKTAVNGKTATDAEKLTGKEYKTEWYNVSSTLLNSKTYDWNWEMNSPFPGPENLHYRKQLTVAGSSAGAQTNYQLKLMVYKGSGTDTGNAVYLNNNCRSDFGDIRFTKSDGVTELDYWIESFTSDTSATVWVEFDSIPASPGTATFYIYYGNTNITTASNGSATFLAFDDFENGTTGQIPSGWVELENPNNGTCQITDNSTGYQGKGAQIVASTIAYSAGRQNLNLTGNYCVYGSFKHSAGNGEFYLGAPSYHLAERIDSSSGYFLYLERDTAWTNTNIAKNSSWHKAKWIVQEGSDWFSLSIDSGTAYTGHIYGTGTSTYLWGARFQETGTVILDNLFATKYVSSEPTFGTWGDEEVCYVVRLNQVEDTTYNATSGSKTSRTRYEYDNYGNVAAQYSDGDIATSTDDSVIHREYCYNTSTNILSTVAHEWVTDSQNSTFLKETKFYYDGNTSTNATPLKGLLTRVVQSENATSTISSNMTYDTYGNLQTSTDPANNVTSFAYDPLFHIYTATQTSPILGVTGNYAYEWNWTEGSDTGVVKITSTDVNGNTTVSYYDTFNRIWKVIKPDYPGYSDNFTCPSIEYQYNNWSIVNQQNITIKTKIDASSYLWQKQYFDGLGRVIQVQASGETGNTTISSTTTFNNRGLVDKQYVSQDIASFLTSYQAPAAGWKYSTSTYDALGRVVSQTGADNTTIYHNYSIAWQDTVTNALGINTHYSYDAFSRLSQVTECNSNNSTYAMTTYAYDLIGNLTDVWDAASNHNHTQMTYNWLSQKTGMDDPDMGVWHYQYDVNGNLHQQTDAKGQTITMNYDALNRLVSKIYPAGSGTADVTYGYDSRTPSDNGTGQRTLMSDASSGVTQYKYDARGRLAEEKKTINGVDYTTGYLYDGADRNKLIIYPSGEYVLQTYNGRGLPYSLYAGVTNLVTKTLYNQLGAMTEINLGNGVKTTYSYWGLDHGNGTEQYGKLWEIKTVSCSLSDHYLTVTGSGGKIQVNGGQSLDDFAQGGYSANTVISIEAIPDPGYQFVRWTGDTANIGDINAASTNITITNGNISIGANFSPVGNGSAGNLFYQQTDYTWDANGNLTTRTDVLTNETEHFTYDSLDRLKTAYSNKYTESYTYTVTGNIDTKNNVQYQYGDPAHAHAVTSVGLKAYAYDANGNMTYRGGQTLAWDAENRLTSVTDSGNVTSFVYDGDGNRVKKIVNGQTVLYVNRFFEVDLSTSTNTSSYYLGGRIVAQSVNATLSYMHQDSLSSTSLMTNSAGNQVGNTVKYLPFGEARATVNVPTDKLFTGQRLDGTGLYYYNARYYDPTIGRFISADPITHSRPLPEGEVIKGLTVYRTLALNARQTRNPFFINPQEHNRYSYALNNPLRYYDPDGHQAELVLYLLIASGVVFAPEIVVPILVAAAAGVGSGYVVAQTGILDSIIAALGDAHREETMWQQVFWWSIFDKDKYSNFKYNNEDIGGNSNFDNRGDKNGGGNVVQSRGATLKDSTVIALNKYQRSHNGKEHTAREWGDALEELKPGSDVGHSDHGIITADSSFYTKDGTYIGKMSECFP